MLNLKLNWNKSLYTKIKAFIKIVWDRSKFIEAILINICGDFRSENADLSNEILVETRRLVQGF